MPKKATTPPAKGKRVITVDFTGVESGGGRVRVPEGDYGLKIVKVLGKKGGDSGKNYLSIDFEIVKGDKRGIGKVIKGHSCSLQPQALWNFKNLLEATGKEVPSKAVKVDLDKLLGATCAGTVIDDEYEGRKHSIVTAFFTLDMLGKTSDSGDELEDAAEEEETEEGEEEAEAEEEEDLFS